ncbi:MAG: hypothetical protein KatS3mg068_1843 [Candidatus Sericytochromatia bacterium]|nr:MAG: hypothetical protein KatS3mg068_1843 [Candidatus Sericytochromatia bacterium]
MLSEEDKKTFREFLLEMNSIFIPQYDKEKGELLKEKLNNFPKEKIIEAWIEVLKAQGPVEKISDYEYEIYDVTNFMDDENITEQDYIHKVTLKPDFKSSQIFMRFYLVFYCLANSIKSSDYIIKD